MAPRVAINGFGRLGRPALRSAYAQGADIERVAIQRARRSGDARQLLLGFGGFRSLLLSSVSQQLASPAACLVVSVATPDEEGGE
jgi:glyceraldehyde-3-phosphate dehydrogenase/erythrose-4-phosphate dehydrogenase